MLSATAADSPLELHNALISMDRVVVSFVHFTRPNTWEPSIDLEHNETARVYSFSTMCARMNIATAFMAVFAFPWKDILVDALPQRLDDFETDVVNELSSMTFGDNILP